MREDRVPRVAAILGAAGLIPFLAGAGFLLLGPPAPFVFQALVAYGAVILSFMGAVHWGLAMQLAREHGPHGADRWFGVSVVPALLGWAAALIGLAGGLLQALGLLTAGFVIIYVIDLLAISAGVAPSWYARLRLPLSFVVVVCLAAAALALV
ncbi:MAG: DUF3429 domain-containing protein [Candidatus Competibacterales bacterium]|nr:DUF3429 domain-containing protein [Candidatus Competibacterales bacterium]